MKPRHRKRNNMKAEKKSPKGFKKITDDQQKKSPKSVKRRQRMKAKQHGYVQKLLNSIKRRMINSPLKNAKQAVSRKLQMRQAESNLQRRRYYNNKSTTDLTVPSDDDCILLDTTEEDQSLQPSTSRSCRRNVEQLIYSDSNRGPGLFYQQAPIDLLYSPIVLAAPKQNLSTSDECIVIDDAPNDSVIFVGEQKATEDFIPLVVDQPTTVRRKRKSSGDVVEPPKKQRPIQKRDTFFSSSEKRELTAYSTNTYNPTVSCNEKLPGSKRPIFIDGSNVAFGHSCSNGFSAEGVKYCIDYFDKMGHEVKAVIPMFRKNRDKSTNPELLDQLHKEGKIVFTPCKNLNGHVSTSYDDRFILQLACARDAAIVSNDNYRDLMHENTAFKKIIENRVIGYTWCNDIFILPKDPYGRWGPTLHEILHY